MTHSSIVYISWRHQTYLRRSSKVLLCLILGMFMFTPCQVIWYRIIFFLGCGCCYWSQMIFLSVGCCSLTLTGEGRHCFSPALSSATCTGCVRPCTLRWVGLSISIRADFNQSVLSDTFADRCQGMWCRQVADIALFKKWPCVYIYIY